MKLAELQGAYGTYLLSGETAALAPAIVEGAFDAGERLAIYRNNFLIGLQDALKANFPVTRQLVGDEFFEQAARRFVREYPPRRPCLFEYGGEFPEYLRALPALAAMRYVAEMARFEFARIEAYNAPAERHLSAESLARLSPAQLDAIPVRLARHVRILSTPAPVIDLWKAHQAADPELAEIDMSPRQRDVLICRPQLSLAVLELESIAARFLAAIRQGAMLGQASVQSGAGDDGAALGRVIAQALELRLLAAD